MSRFNGKVAIITGAGSGIAQATARRFGSEEATVACLDIDEGAAQKTAGAIVETGGKRVGVPLQRRGSGSSVTAAVGSGGLEPGCAKRALQYRRRRQLREHHRLALRRMAARDRGEPHRHLPHVPGGAAAHPRERRQHRQHGFERGSPGSRLLGGVLRVEGRRGAAHSRPGDRVLEARHPRECRRAWRRRHSALPRGSRCPTTPTCRSWRR